MDSLTDLELAMLDLEQKWWSTTGGKEAAIAALGLSPVRYYQLLAKLIRTHAAVQYDSLTVGRLVRISDTRRDVWSDFGGS